MEVYGELRHKVTIDPVEVLDKLISSEFGDDGYTRERDGKYYHTWDQSAGCHSIDMEEEISKEQYDYVKALKLAKEYLIHKINEDERQKHIDND